MIAAGSPQVVVTTAEAGARPRTLATLHGFAKSLEYTPDGRALAMLYVEGATRPSGALAAMKPPSGEIGVEGLEVQRVAMLDAASGELRQISPAGLHVYEFSFAQNSRQIAFVAAAPAGREQLVGSEALYRVGHARRSAQSGSGPPALWKGRCTASKSPYPASLRMGSALRSSAG